MQGGPLKNEKMVWRSILYISLAELAEICPDYPMVQLTQTVLDLNLTPNKSSPVTSLLLMTLYLFQMFHSPL